MQEVLLSWIRQGGDPSEVGGHGTVQLRRRRARPWASYWPLRRAQWRLLSAAPLLVNTKPLFNSGPQDWSWEYRAPRISRPHTERGLAALHERNEIKVSSKFTGPRCPPVQLSPGSSPSLLRQGPPYLQLLSAHCNPLEEVPKKAGGSRISRRRPYLRTAGCAATA